MRVMYHTALPVGLAYHKLYPLTLGAGTQASKCMPLMHAAGKLCCTAQLVRMRFLIGTFQAVSA